MSPYHEKVQLIEKAILLAASHLLEASKDKSKIEVQSKPDYTIVMNLDLECQAKIKGILDGDIPVLAEEDELSHSLIGKEANYFIVDPIDGTASCRRYLGKEGGEIGFGPLAGYVENGCLKIAVYYNIPSRTLYSAVLGEGSLAVQVDPASPLPQFSQRRKLLIETPLPLNQSAILFYPGSMEELQAVMQLRTKGIVENTYRFGGFANDSVRLAENFEQLQLQTRVKAWDFPAVLIAKEAGYNIVIDPFIRKIGFESWIISKDNPVLVAHHSVMDDLLRNII